MTDEQEILVNIRSETLSDVMAIEALIVAAFNNAEHTSHTEHRIVDALRAASQPFISLVAEEQDVIIGHVAVSPVSISDGSEAWYGLGPISVEPTRQGQGVGSLLVQHVLAALRRSGAAGCVVLGDPGFYHRFGFRAVSGLILSGVPPEYFQALSFQDNVPTGSVTYHEAFNI